MADKNVILASVSTIITVAAARKRRRCNRSRWVSDFNFDSTVFINIHEVSTLLPICSTLLPIRWALLPIRSTMSSVCTGPKQHGRLWRLSTKSTVLNSTLLPVCTSLNRNKKTYSTQGQASKSIFGPVWPWPLISWPPKLIVSCPCPMYRLC